jgi:glyoxylase-like metal-dependent hydrolase (beta-lactamase superfamily II)
MTLVEGETEIMPGVRVFETPGHSVGHQAVEVDTNTGKYIICGDAIFILDNIKPISQIHYNITPPNRYVNIVETWRSIEKIKNRAQSEDRILTCHDKSMLERVIATPVIG